MVEPASIAYRFFFVLAAATLITIATVANVAMVIKVAAS